MNSSKVLVFHFLYFEGHCQRKRRWTEPQLIDKTLLEINFVNLQNIAVLLLAMPLDG